MFEPIYRCFFLLILFCFWLTIYPVAVSAFYSGEPPPYIAKLLQAQTAVLTVVADNVSRLLGPMHKP